MSMYNVVSNSYNDVLNTLDNDHKSHTGGLKGMFDNISDDKKRSIIIKLADTTLMIETAFNSEISYWNGIRKENTFFMIMYAVLTGIIGFVVIWIALMFVTKAWRKDQDLFSIIKILLRFILIMHIVLSVMIILILNARVSLKYAKGQMDLLNQDLGVYNSYLFQGSSKDDMAKLFLFIAYFRKRTVGKYKRLYNELQTYKSYTNVLALYDIGTSADTSVSQETRKLSLEVQVYNLLKEDIQNSLIVFYKEGEGYTEVKKKIMLSSPFMMLKEVQKVMTYYSSYGLKKDLTLQSSQDSSERRVVNEMITKPLLNLIDEIPDNTEPNEADITSSVLLNEKNSRFKLYYNRLLEAFYFTALFIYPLSTGIMPEDPKFTPASIIESMPYNIKNNVKEENEIKYREYIRDFFYNLKTGADYERFVKAAPATSGIQKMCEAIRPIFSDLYFKVFYNMEGSVKYPLIRTFMINGMMNYFRVSPANALPQEYLTMIANTMYDAIIKPIGGSINVLEIRQGVLIDKLSKSLAETTIDILKYQNDVLITISESNPKSKNNIDLVTRLLDEINQRTIIERQIQKTSDISKKYKFNSIEDFTKLVDNLSFEAFVAGFQIDYFKDVIDKFYKNISESVMLKYKNQRNIYYYRQQSLQLFRALIIMIIIAVIILYLIFSIHAFGDFKTIKLRETSTQCDEKFAWRELRGKIVSWVIKLLLPLLIMIIGMALLVSMYKKGRDQFEFNLEIIETNTNGLKTLLEDLSIMFDEMKKKMVIGDSVKSINNIPTITGDDKKMILEQLIKIIDKYEKCNYIVEAGNKAIPFPYTDIVIYGFLLLIGVGCVLYIIVTLKPIDKIVNIKKLNKMIEQVYTANELSGINEQIKNLSICHNEDTDAIILSIKLIFIVVITVFMLFYSVKIVGEGNDFKQGLYNSSYFTESKCYGT